MKKLTFLFTVLAFTCICSSVFAQLTKEQAITEWQRAKAYTKKYLDAMPDDGYTFKATPEIRTFAGQMLHIADANYYFASVASGKASPLGKTSAEKTVAQTKEATTKAVMDSYDFAISAIESVPPDQMQQIATAEGMKVTKAQLLAKAFEHQTHHRGQTTIYLRLKGVTPPGEMLF
ncbi:MAG: DinB family protein [Mucilaginibacter sp.]|nr:DinB family protein [Mucilaginibacter sp.]